MVAITHSSRPEQMPLSAGIGLRLPHLAEVVATTPTVGWLEVHPENFLANPHATELLVDVSRRYPMSVHSVGISIGSADGIDRHHLQRLRAFVDVVDPVLVSGPLAWSSFHGTYLNDLLPLPYDDQSLRIVATHLAQVQDALGRPYLIENPATYVAFSTSTMTELEFLNALVERTGCQLLCDVSNIYLSGHNMGYDPYSFVDGLPAAAIGELHLGGFTAEDDEATAGATLLVDTHASTIAEPVWDLYAYTLRRLGAKPTLIEWDNELPRLDTLVAESARADVVRIGTLAADHARTC
jgi:uncharacterized protein (UPF0276 family)